MTALSWRSAAEQAPHSDALVIGETRFTFADLADRVAATAIWLEANRSGAGPVALFAEPTLDTMVLVYASLEIGACIAPLLTSLSEREVKQQLAQLAPSLMIPRGFSVPPGHDQTALATADALATAGVGGTRQATDIAHVDDSDALAILFTSGSTGTAKAAVLSRNAFVTSAAASALNLGWRDDDRWLLSLSVAHVGGLSILIRCLVARRCVVVDSEPGFDATHSAQLLAERRVTLWSAVPTMLQRLMDLAPRWAPPRSLRAILLGGAAPSAALLGACAARDVPAVTTYGMTETCAQICTQAPACAPDPQAGSGLPLSHADVRIAADNAIEVRSPSLLDRYLPPHDMSPPTDPDGWFRTGDRGRLDEAGRLHVLGRLDHVIVTGGECVDPLEVERALQQFGPITEACVFGMPDAQWGELVATVVTSPGPLDHDALRRHLRSQLAGFKRPRRIHVVSALPVSATGKRDRDAIIAECTSQLEPL